MLTQDESLTFRTNKLAVTRLSLRTLVVVVTMLLAPPGLADLPDPPDLLANLDSKVLAVKMETPAPRAPQDSAVSPAVPAHKDRTVTRVCLVTLAPLDLLDLVDPMDLPACLDSPDPKDTVVSLDDLDVTAKLANRERRVTLVPPDLWEPLDLLVREDHLESEVVMVPLDPRVSVVTTVAQAAADPPDLSALLDPPAFPAPQESREIVARQDSPDPRDLLDPQAVMDVPVSPALSVSQVSGVRMDPQEPRVPGVTMDPPALPDFQDPRDLPDRLDQMDNQAPRAMTEETVATEPQATPARLDRPVHPEKEESPVCPVWKEREDLTALPDPRDLPEPKERVDLLELVAFLEPLDCPDLTDKMAPVDLPENVELVEAQVLPEQSDPRDLSDHAEAPEPPAKTVAPVSVVLWVTTA